MTRSASSVNTVGVSTTEQVPISDGATGGCESEASDDMHNEAPYDIHPVIYTYTPTVQKSATTPKPPRMLARDATLASRMGILSFGSLHIVA